MDQHQENRYTPAMANTPKLKPLSCAACGGMVPLGDGNEVTCPYCQQPVPIPPDYQMLRDAARQQAQAREAVNKAYERLGKPPGPLLRFWGGTAGKVVATSWKIIVGILWVWVFLLKFLWDALNSLDDWRIVAGILLMPFGVLYGALWVVARFIHLMAVPLGIDLVDVLSLGWTFLGLGGFLLLLTAVPKVLFEYLESFAQVRRQLQACLAAQPPKTSGGPATCRSCGAALAIPTGALGVRCVYCQADNLVALPMRWVTRAKDRSQTFYHQVSAAERQENTVRHAARSAALTTILIALIVPFVASGCGWTMVHLRLLEGRLNWRLAIASPRELLPHTCTLFDQCTGDKVGVFDLAIRRGDTVELTRISGAVPDNLLVRHMNSRRPVRVVWNGTEEHVSGRVVVKASGWLILDGAGRKDDWEIHVRPTKEKLLPIE